MKILEGLVAIGVAGLLSFGGTVPAQASATTLTSTVAAQQLAEARDCTALNNLDELAAKFISRCRKASIRREFPSDYLSRYLSEIRSDSSAKGKKAWKLLNDSRFKK